MKIRTDFVTNSSSSSFVVEYSVKLTSGKELTYMSKALNIEDGAEPCTIVVSPKQLAKAADINALCKLLKHSAVIGADESEIEDVGIKDYQSSLHTPPGASKFIAEIAKLDSLKDISQITIVGEEIFRYDWMWKRSYTYDLVDGNYSLTEVGDSGLAESAEGRGGGFYFTDAKPKMVIHYDGYPTESFASAILSKYPYANLAVNLNLQDVLSVDSASYQSLVINKGENIAAIVLLASDEDKNTKSIKEIKAACKQDDIFLVQVDPKKSGSIKTVITKVSKLGLDDDLLNALQNRPENENVAPAAQTGTGCIVKVKFADKRVFEYNCFEDLKPGDIVYVEGTREGSAGYVYEVTGKAPQNDYCCVTGVVR